MQEIDLVHHPMTVANPTDVHHTPTPWKKGVGRHDDGHTITSQSGAPIAFFQNQDDRDLAVYFVNVHRGVIRILEELADKFEFIAHGPSAQNGTTTCAREFAATARAYADIFRKVGQIETGKTTEAIRSPGLVPPPFGQ